MEADGKEDFFAKYNDFESVVSALPERLLPLSTAVSMFRKVYSAQAQGYSSLQQMLMPQICKHMFTILNSLASKGGDAAAEPDTALYAEISEIKMVLHKRKQLLVHVPDDDAGHLLKFQVVRLWLLSILPRFLTLCIG